MAKAASKHSLFSLQINIYGEEMKERLKRIIVLVGLLAVMFFCGLINNAFAQKLSNKNTAIGTVKSFYQFHRASKNIFNKTQVEARRKWFASDLYGLFNNELKLEREFLKANPSEKPYFGDGFPFQPYDECLAKNKSYLNTHKINLVTLQKNKVTIEVKFYEPKICGGEFIDNYKVELIKTNGRWQIRDWIYSDGRRLTTDLKTPHY